MSNLDTFAKVRALHDSTTNPGEKAAAAVKMQTLARKAGMTVAEAVSKLDAPQPRTPAQAAADVFNDFFNTPEMRAQRASREAERLAQCAELLRRYGSEDAVFAETPVEAACRAACDPLKVDDPRPEWRGHYHLDGWSEFGGPTTMPESVRAAVSRVWPLPKTVAAAWAEFQAADALESHRCTFEPAYTPHRWVEARGYVVEDLLNALPAHTLDDLRARGAWLEFQANEEVAQDAIEHRTLVATLRADIERLACGFGEAPASAVQTGQWADTASPAPSAAPPVQPGQPRRTNADKRRDVLALLGLGLADREVARRAGVSPTTVGAIRKSLA